MPNRNIPSAWATSRRTSVASSADAGLATSRHRHAAAASRHLDMFVPDPEITAGYLHLGLMSSPQVSHLSEFLSRRV
jgi:hypothetical protein